MDRDETGMKFRPPHPGEYLKEDILPALGMSVTDLAAHLEVCRASLSELINQRRGVSTNMAIRLGQAFRNGARFWLALQMQHDLWREENTAKPDVAPLDWEGRDAA
jgi:addiction module HigA family antidote